MNDSTVSSSFWTGGGYVISKNALMRLGNEFEQNDLNNIHNDHCPSSKADGPEDVLIGKFIINLYINWG